MLSRQGLADVKGPTRPKCSRWAACGLSAGSRGVYTFARCTSCCMSVPLHMRDIYKHVLKAHLVKISEQPGLGGREGADAPKCVPDGQCAPNKLVASGRFHRVDAHVGATQPYGALRGCCACRVVFWHHQTMPAVAACLFASGNMGCSLSENIELPDGSLGSTQI